MKKMVRVAVMTGLLCSLGSAASAATFKDFQNFYWAKPAVDRLVEAGIITGFKDNTFKPGKQVTRAEFVTMINKAFSKYNENADVNFSDVWKYQWFYKQVASAKQAGYVTGYQGKFSPNLPITRAEAAVMMARVLELDVAKIDTAQKFSDLDSIPPWAVGSISALAEKTVMTGYEDRTFRSAKYINRAEAAATVDRAIVMRQGKLK